MTKSTCPVVSCTRPVRAGGLCDAHYRRKLKYGDPEFMHSLTCATCGAGFEAHNPRTKYCSKKCSPDYSGNKCQDCATPIANRSKRCAKCHLDFARSRRSYKPAVTHPDIDCPICGETFTPKRSREAWTRSCSKPCAMRLAIREGAHNLQDGKQVGRDMEKVERNWRRRRALKLSAKSEPYTKEQIAKRDNYRCYLCGDPVDMDLEFPDRGFPTVEHVVALANGGDDTPENVMLAHLICNMRKGTKTLEEVQHGSEEIRSRA